MSWMLFALIGAGFAALVAIFAKIGLEGVDTTFATALRAIIMAVFLVAISLSLGKFDLGNLPPGKALLFIALSGIAGALSWLAMFAALKMGPAPGVSAIDRTSVIFVLIFSILFLGTQFTWKAALGALLIAAGAILLL